MMDDINTRFKNVAQQIKAKGYPSASISITVEMLAIFEHPEHLHDVYYGATIRADGYDKFVHNRYDDKVDTIEGALAHLEEAAKAMPDAQSRRN